MTGSNPPDDPNRGYRIGADIGGTFTDVVLVTPDGRSATRKVSSTVDDYSVGIVSGIEEILAELGEPGSTIREIVHGTTVATNVILENKGARTALITTAGFRDVLELRRLRIPELFSLEYTPPPPLVRRRYRLEVSERIDANGVVLTPLDMASADAGFERIAEEGIEAIAICLLNSYRNFDHESQLAEVVRRKFPNLFVSVSSEVLPEIREYERTSTTVINSYVGPTVANYLRSLSSQLQSAQIGAPIRIMQSNGGVMSDAAAAMKPSHIIESGPAAGVVGGAYLARQAGIDNLITFDMGGTTAKASMVEAGEPTLTTEYEVGAGISLSSRLVKGRGHALKLPVIDIAEVGAGGGSIVRIDSGGALKVGPDSAGAFPGPVCYETGGVDPTVTDANVTLGFINPQALAGGVITLNRDKAIESIQKTAAEPLKISALDAAHGVYEIANVSMIRAIKAVTTYRGRDPREFAMLAFGGSGPIHAAGIARSLGIRTVIVPPAPGLFSAFGLLTAAPAYRFVQTLFRKVDNVDIEQLDNAFARLRRTAAESLREQDQDPDLGAWTALADLRYSGQGYELSINFSDDGGITSEGLLQTVKRFHEEHDRTYGHRSDDEPVELVNIRYLVVFPSEEQPASVTEIARTNAEAKRDAYFGPDHGLLSTPVVGRADIGAHPTVGPIIVDEYDATTVVPPDAWIHRDELNNLILTFEEA